MLRIIPATYRTSWPGDNTIHNKVLYSKIR